MCVICEWTGRNRVWVTCLCNQHMMLCSCCCCNACWLFGCCSRETAVVMMIAGAACAKHKFHRRDISARDFARCVVRAAFTSSVACRENVWRYEAMRVWLCDLEAYLNYNNNNESINMPTTNNKHVKSGGCSIDVVCLCVIYTISSALIFFSKNFALVIQHIQYKIRYCLITVYQFNHLLNKYTLTTKNLFHFTLITFKYTVKLFSNQFCFFFKLFF